MPAIAVPVKWAEETGSQISEQGRPFVPGPPGIGRSNPFGGSPAVRRHFPIQKQWLPNTVMQGQPPPQGGPQLLQAPQPVRSESNLAMAQSLIAKYKHEYTTSSTFSVICCVHESS